jgi:hypothetical protein
MQDSDRQAAFMDTTLPDWFSNDKSAQPGEPIFFKWLSEDLNLEKLMISFFSINLFVQL